MILFTAEQCNACHMNQHFFEETWKAVKSQTLLNDKLMLATVYCQKDLELCKEMEVTQVRKTFILNCALRLVINFYLFGLLSFFNLQDYVLSMSYTTSGRYHQPNF